MGGGGAIRAASKAAGIGILSGGLRSTGAENPVSVAARKVSSVRASSYALASTEDVKLVASSSQNEKLEQSVQRPVWEVDDWEFAGSEEEFVVDKVQSPAPRLVFGPAPSLQEAKEATSELKDALDRIYFSPTHFESVVPSVVPGLVTFPQSEDSARSDACVTHEMVLPPVPNHAMQAFRMLKESSAAQDVVASIAADPNVWNAVLQNEALQEYLESMPKYFEPEGKEESDKCSVSSDADSRTKSGGWFTDVVQYVKNGLVEMATNVSDYFVNIFGSSTSKTESGPPNGIPTAIGGSFMALAVMVIIMIIFRRA